MAAITRLSPDGYGARLAGSFAGKSTAGVGHPVARIARLSLDGYGARRAGSFAGKTASQASISVAGDDSRPARIRRRRLYLDGKLYMVTPEEELRLINEAVADLDREITAASKRIAASPASKAASRLKKAVEKIEVKRDERKIYKALLADQHNERKRRAQELVLYRARRRLMEDDEDDLLMMLAHFN